MRHDHPELADRMYPSGLIADAGLPVVLSSDAPVTDPDVMLACWAAETRITASGQVLGEACRITRQQAFEGYTVGGAHALRRDNVGSLASGRLADLVILDADPWAVPIDQLPDVSVEETWVDGRPAWTYDRGLVGTESP
ncbi:MAG TPA: hypothetical protein DCG16_09865 [Gemmatimonadetes bacterium]|nr:hypothetical protein [Gemmatimonadota bacterium]